MPNSPGAPLSKGVTSFVRFPGSPHLFGIALDPESVCAETREVMRGKALLGQRRTGWTLPNLRARGCKNGCGEFVAGSAHECPKSSERFGGGLPCAPTGLATRGVQSGEDLFHCGRV